jgi:hypothetical protein
VRRFEPVGGILRRPPHFPLVSRFLFPVVFATYFASVPILAKYARVTVSHRRALLLLGRLDGTENPRRKEGRGVARGLIAVAQTQIGRQTHMESQSLKREKELKF